MWFHSRKHGLTICPKPLSNGNGDASNLACVFNPSHRGVAFKNRVLIGVNLRARYSLIALSPTWDKESDFVVWWICSHGRETREKQSEYHSLYLWRQGHRRVYTAWWYINTLCAEAIACCGIKVHWSPTCSCTSSVFEAFCFYRFSP